VVKWTRSVTPGEDGSLQISIIVSNVDPTAWDADRVILREEIPTGKVYRRASAMVNGEPATLLSVNPLQIDVGAVPYHDSRLVVYRITKDPG
jgi:hypothetical protein